MHKLTNSKMLKRNCRISTPAIIAASSVGCTVFYARSRVICPVLLHSLRTPLLLVACILFATSVYAPVSASDYLHDCKPVGGNTDYELDARKRAVYRAGTTTPINYQKVKRTRLRLLEGYCQTSKGRFKYRTEVYGLTIKFVDNGQQLRRTFKCEFGRDGTPAGLKCKRDVQLQNFTAPAKYRNKFE